MIRDRLVVDLRDAKLSEKLQLDSELTLEKAVNQARQSEALKKQQNILKGGPLGEGSKVDLLAGKKGNQRRKETPKPNPGYKNKVKYKANPGSNCSKAD